MNIQMNDNMEDDDEHIPSLASPPQPNLQLSGGLMSLAISNITKKEQQDVHTTHEQ